MDKIKFLIDQTGPVELTTNMGTDPAFIVPITFSSDNTDLNELMKEVALLYYHASEGWKPLVIDEEKTVYDIIGDTFDGINSELSDRLSLAMDRFGNQALGNLFRQARALWALLKQNDSFKPASIDSDKIDEIFGK